MPQMTEFEFLDKATVELADTLVKSLVFILFIMLDPEDIEPTNRYPVLKQYKNMPLSVNKIQSIAGNLGTISP